MAQISLFYNAVKTSEDTWDREYTAEDFALFFSTLYRNGVVMPVRDAFQIKPASTGGMRVVVSSGAANINGYQFINTEDFAIEIAVASASQSRTDSIGIQHNLGERETKIYYKQGDVSVARQDDVWELQLAQINVIRNAVEITASNIKDMRADEKVCGYASPYMEVSVSGLEQQYQSMLEESFATFEKNAKDNETALENMLTNQEVRFDEWFQGLQNQLDENQATNLQNQINLLKADQLTWSLTDLPAPYPQVSVTGWQNGFGITALGETGWLGDVPETIPVTVGYPSKSEAYVKVPLLWKMSAPVITETEPYSYLLVEGTRSLRIKLIGVD